MPARPRRRHTTFLVAPAGNRKSGVPVYAAQVHDAAEALEAVLKVVGPDQKLKIVGSLSTRSAKAINLKPGEVRAV